MSMIEPMVSHTHVTALPARRDLDRALAARTACRQRLQRLEGELRLAIQLASAAFQLASAALLRLHVYVRAQEEAKTNNVRLLEDWIASGAIGNPPRLTVHADTTANFQSAQTDRDAWRSTVDRLRSALELAREQVAWADKRVYIAARNVAITEMLRLAEEAEQHEARALALREEILGIDFAFNGEYRHSESEPLPKAVTRALTPPASDYARILAAAERWQPRLAEMLQGCEASECTAPDEKRFGKSATR